MIARHPSDELPGLVRGELAPDAAASVYGHVDDCDRCQRDLDAVRHASEALEVTAKLDGAGAPGGVAVPASGGDGARGRRRRLTVLVIGVVVLVSAVTGVWGLVRTSEGAGPQAGPATTLTAIGAGGGEGQAKVTGDERRKVVTLETLDLPAAAPGHHYEVWLTHQGRPPMVALGQLATDNQGIWSVPASVAGRYDGQTIEVWLEAEDGDPVAAGKPVLRGPFRDS